MKDSQLKNLYDYLEIIKPRPAMYIGEYTLKALHINLQGFQIAERIYSREPSKPDFDGFHDFVAKQYGLQPSAEGWARIITRKMKKDHEKAFEEFYRLLEMFKQEA
jgi:hypothetical protein